ncbi:CDGSH iron-sulfur domain-containing protein [Flavobacteriaceae bacterium R38]|nr:CDGSH iron-sulfur domain-containing protein [Flavobacteriaceae bacterium R38]
MDLPKRAGDAPLAVELEEGKRYSWCTCGLSENQPFCDGKHRGSGMEPKMMIAEKSGTHYLCTCKLTGNPGFCDGSHKN